LVLLYDRIKYQINKIYNIKHWYSLKLLFEKDEFLSLNIILYGHRHQSS